MDTIVWISGASRGIGAALAATVPYEQARVIDISRSGGVPGAEHLAADLADPSAWAAVESHFVARLGGFDGKRVVFIHSAGLIEPIGFAGEVRSDAYRQNVLVNAAAPQVLGHGFLRAIRESGFDGEAHLVMLSSGAASSPYEGWSGYCAGKAAVEMWVRCAGLEQQRRGGRCRVIAVAPGVVATAMQERIRETSPEAFPRVDKFHALHREGELRAPEDAARDIWTLLDHELENGAVVDARNL
jgi:benzil reductase ((S)-benzoin forming)